MIGPIASAVMSAMRLLTPDQIGRLVQSNPKLVKSVRSIPKLGPSQVEVEDSTLSASQDGLSQAKILPLERREQQKGHDDQKEKQKYDLPQTKNERSLGGPVNRVENNNFIAKASPATGKNLESIGVLSHEQLAQQEKEREQIKKEQEPSASVFILSEREKLKENNQKLSSGQAKRSYQRQLRDGKSGDEGIHDSSSGILLDKKLS